MFSWVSIASGLVKAFNMLMSWLRDRQLVQSGRELQQGDQNAAVLDHVKKADKARADADKPDVAKSLDDELRID